MFKNLIVSAIRNLKKKPAFTFINILGLSLGMATCLLITLYVQYDLSFDDYQDNNVYRVALKRIYPEREVEYAFTPHSISPQMVLDFPEVLDQARLFKVSGSVILEHEEDQFAEENVVFADSSIFRLIKIDFINGNQATALTDPSAIVLTERIAKKIFGSTDIIGETLQTPNGPLQISAIVENYPENSHFTFDVLIPLHSLDFFNQQNWTGFSALSYIKVTDGTDPAQVEAKLPALIKEYADGEIKARNGISYDEYLAAGNGYIYTLQPIKDIFLHSKLEGELRPTGNITYVYIFSIVAVFILFIASINFMNLSTARSVERGKEVGIRKVLGSSKSQLIKQFLTEAILITLGSAVVAILFAFVCLPFFNEIAQRQLTLSVIFQPAFLSSMVFIILAIGLLSGIYPAFFISSFSAIKVLKGNLKTASAGINLRNSLVIAQFAISIALISATLIVYDQMSFLMQKSLGFNQQDVLVVDNAFSINNTDDAINLPRFETFRNEIESLPYVTTAAFTSAMPGDILPGYLLRVPGTGKESMVARNVTFDQYMLEASEMNLVAGRFFDNAFNDSLSMILNQTAVDKLAIDSPIGKKVINIDNDNELVEYTIIGVMEDFHFQSLHVKMEPIAVTSPQSRNAFFNKMIVRMDSDHQQAAALSVQDKWDEFVQDSPFTSYYLEERLEGFYTSEKATMKIFGVFALLAIIIACIGLLGLSAFIINQRVKEIGVRKVLGASATSIITLFAKDFVKLILIAAFIAVPAAYFWISSWLENFAYSSGISVSVFLLAVLVALLIGVVTIGIQSIKAAVANPVKSLRDD